VKIQTAGNTEGKNMFITRFNSSTLVDLGISILVMALIIIFGQRLINLLIRGVLSKITARTSTQLDDALLNAARMPLFWLIFVLGLEFSVRRLSIIPASWNVTLDDIFFVLYTLVVVLFLWNVLASFFNWYTNEIAEKAETSLAEQTLPFLRRVVLILLVVIAGIILLDHFNIEISALVTTLGIGSLAIALAAQAALSDTISGFVIMFERPFRIGDRIELQDLGTWGDVVDIGLRSTRIRTLDNRMVIVPNSLIGKSLVVNHSFPNDEYRIQIEVGVAYGTDLEKARQTLVQAVRGVEGVLLDHPIEALFLQFGDSSLVFRVRWWIESYADTRRMFDKVNSTIYRALGEAGITIPFPQRDVHHKVDASDISRIQEVLNGEDRPATK